MSSLNERRLIDAAACLMVIAILALVISLSINSLEILSGVDIADGYLNHFIGSSVTYCFHAIKVCIVF